MWHFWASGQFCDSICHAPIFESRSYRRVNFNIQSLRFRELQSSSIASQRQRNKEPLIEGSALHSWKALEGLTEAHTWLYETGGVHLIKKVCSPQAMCFFALINSCDYITTYADVEHSIFRYGIYFLWSW